MPSTMKHSDLCKLAVSWLKRPFSRGGHGCTVAIDECRTGWGGEIPDAVGYRYSGMQDTSTGHAPDPQKIFAMGEGGALAIASGMTPENVATYAPALTHILVATGVSRTEHHIDPAKLSALIGQLRQNVTP